MSGFVLNCLQHFFMAYPEEEKAKSKILILDLDHTLIHSLRIENVAFPLRCPETYNVINVKLTDNTEETYIVRQRSRLLRAALNVWKGEFDIYVYTQAIKTYAEAVMDMLDPQEEFFDKRKRLMATPDNMAGQLKSKSIKRMIETLNLQVNGFSLLIVDDNLDVWEEQDRKFVFQINPFVDWLYIFPLCPTQVSSMQVFSKKDQMDYHTEIRKLWKRNLNTFSAHTVCASCADKKVDYKDPSSAQLFAQEFDVSLALKRFRRFFKNSLMDKDQVSIGEFLDSWTLVQNLVPCIHGVYSRVLLSLDMFAQCTLQLPLKSYSTSSNDGIELGVGG